ncbi:hypothetical protein ABT093_18630 [Kitasatospora sp. NPDC002551]|uniref:hypothetical protein n=1 Tax=unclassified Kitasatospora TaxID=2633591 RepID=UPI00331F59D2
MEQSDTSAMRSATGSGRRTFLRGAVGVTALGLVGAAGAVRAEAAPAPGQARLNATQNNWRFCQKCFVMFFWGYPSDGVCPAGGAHSAQGYNFILPYDVPETATAQRNWRFCQKCYSMFFWGYPSDGVCPAGGAHSAQGFNFVLPHDVPETPTQQRNWRFCQKCYSMYFWGYPTDGVCPAGGAHSAQGYNFALPHS